MKSARSKPRNRLTLMAVLVVAFSFSLSTFTRAAQLLSLRLVPEEVTLRGAGAGQRFLVLAKYGDGLEREITRECRFSVADTRIAQVIGGGRLKAQADGETVLKAKWGEHVAKARIQIKGSVEERPFSFPRDIGAIFTKRGCNQSVCHSGVKGRNGFKLSTDALLPREDYSGILEGEFYEVLSAESSHPKNPRINLEKPEKSLLLLKPTFSVPHGGGERFEVGSPDYQTILRWVRDGAPYGQEESARVERLEIFPEEVVLDGKGKHQLLVTAVFSDGAREDFSEEAFYESKNPDVVKVTSEGLVKAVGVGETALLIRAAGHAVSAPAGVIAKVIADYPEVESRNFIDDFVFAKLRRFHILPSPLSGDSEFLRRICLDLTGTLPPAHRVREFLANKDPQKREKLIRILLDTPEFVDYWTWRFSDVFRAGVSSTGRTPDEEGYWKWIRDSIAQNRPYDEVARERLAAKGSHGAAYHYWFTGKTNAAELIMAEEVRVFWGRRLDCVQCHDHPYDRWTQKQFWGLAAFFGRLATTGANRQSQTIHEDPEGPMFDYGEKGRTELTFRKTIHPRTQEKVEPAFLDGRVLPEEKRKDMRPELARWMTSHPYFAEAAVNRIWGYFFGRGIVDPVDDFAVTNPATHPKLLKALAQDFRENGHDLKRLMRLIVSSRTYQLSRIPNETNVAEKVNYSRALPRPLDAEVLLDAIVAVTGVAEIFMRVGLEKKAPPGTRAINLTSAANWPSRFLEIYGRPLRQAVPERGREQPSLAQALHMLAGPTFTEKLSGEGGRLDQLLGSGASDTEIMEELYLTALSRFPRKEEREKLNQVIAQQPSRRLAFEHLMWALIVCREFAYNH